jgi:hypothetical protein
MTQHYRNEYLFSEIYLREITEIEEDQSVLATLAALKEYREYANTKTLLDWNKSFIHEVLKALKFGVRASNENVALLHQIGSTDEILSLCFCLLPTESLDNTLMGRNWAEKIIRNLRSNNLTWGILTNGYQWRIYHTDESTPYENYLEIDLANILESENVKQFQIFYKFMKAENFIRNGSNCHFDIFKDESQEKINYIEEELRNALKQKEGEGGKGILSNLCMGYVDYLRKMKRPDFSDDTLREDIYRGAMLYMFRLLFLFYAEGRGLLSEPDKEIFELIVNTAKKNQEQGILNKESYKVWEDLRTIFSNIGYCQLNCVNFL